MAGVEYSVIIPLLNEEESLKPLWKQLKEVRSHLGKTWEVVFVDDGSKDNSFKVLNKLSQDYPEIKIIRFPYNQGKAAALQAGFKVVTGKIVITMDADLQDDPQEIIKLVNVMEKGYDLVSGWKKERHDPIDKTLPSYFFNLMVRKLSGIPLHDINCGLKAYRKQVVKSLSIYGELYRFIPIMAANQGFRVAEVPVNHRPRSFGHSKFGAGRFIRGFLDLLTVLFLTRFIKKPLHFFGPIGLSLAVVGFAFCAYLTYIHFVWNERVGDRPLLMFGILFILAGLQLLFTGLIAELITHYAQRNREHPLYLESEGQGVENVEKYSVEQEVDQKKPAII